ncbi:MAG TPA: hypothetical protein VIW92_14770 [Thermoanaerobaculia bacterium]
MTTRRILASFFILTLLLAGGAAAQTPDGPARLIVPLSEDNPGLDDVAMDGAGNMTFLWTKLSLEGNLFKEQAFTRRFSADGTPLGGAVQLASASVESRGGSVAANQRGDYVVTWSRLNPGGTKHFLRWRSPLRGTTFVRSIKGLADVAIDNNGNFVAVWTAPTPDGTRVFGQRYRANGTTQGPEFNAATLKTGNHGSPSVAMNPNTGEFVVVWEVRNDERSLESVRGQRFGFFTGRQGSEFVVYTQPAGEPTLSFNIYSPQVARAANGSFVVAWRTVSDGVDVLAQRYNTEGVPLGGRIVIAEDAGITDGIVRIAMAPNGRFVVSWDDRGTSPQWLRLFRPNGTPFGPVLVEPPFEAPYNGNGRVAFGKNDSFVLGWTNYNDEGPSNTISFRLYDVP